MGQRNLIYGIDMDSKTFWAYDMDTFDVVRCVAYMDEGYSDGVNMFKSRYNMTDKEFSDGMMFAVTPLQGLAFRAKQAWCRMEIMKDPFTEDEIDSIIADVMKDVSLA